jgi:probable HAF family extracellular repeat protein
MKLKSTLILALMLLAFCWRTDAQFTAYDLGPGMAYGINDSGVVVGQSGSGYAFSYSGGVMSDLGSGWTAFGINDSGTIVGGTADIQIGYAVIYSGGVLTDIGNLGSYGAFGSCAYGINNSGTVVGGNSGGGGFSYSAGMINYIGGPSASAINNSGTIVGGGMWGGGFIYSGGVMTTPNIGTIYSINDSGTVVGGYSGINGQYAFSYSLGVTSVLPLGSWGPAAATAINNAGTIAGYYTTFNDGQHAFSYSDGQMTDFEPYLASIGLTGNSQANAIDGNGDIVGYGTTASGEQDAFLFVVPEPSSVTLLALGVLGIVWRTKITAGSPTSRR